MNYQEIEGDLIQLALQGSFDVIVHGCNCFCLQKAGIAAVMSKTFHTDRFEMEHYTGHGKLGTIDFETVVIGKNTNWLLSKYKNNADEPEIIVVNAYTQYQPGANLDYEALTLCLRKINHEFKGKHIGLPQIGCGIAGGVWDKYHTPQEELYRDVRTIIQQELKDCKVTVVKFKNHE
jgi:O-acetyl-ADP-ribose deacetylase (regulator of RNase III)